MNSAHDYLAEIARAGAGRFAQSSLASGHAGVTRRVRRHRTGRAAATTVAGIGVIGGATWGGMEAFARGNALAPGVPASSTATSSPLATPDSLSPECANAALLITDPSSKAYPNGELPAEVLCAVTGKYTGSTALRGDAGLALEATLARMSDLGLAQPCVAAGYRSLADQENIAALRGYLVAEPGSSVHGAGLAVDLCAVDGNPTDQYTDFAAVAADFGWVRTLDGEPWHFEYQPGAAGQGAPVAQRMTIPGGQTLNEIAAKLAEAYGVTPQDALSALTASVTTLIPEASTAEGWPMPSTFDLTGGVSLNDASDMLVAARVQELTNLGVPRADWQRVLTEASLVEREAKLDVDRPKIARVIENRLANDMRLEFDSTVKYIAPGDGIFITDKERATDSPYNTYLYQGLPPGAIATPSDESIRAALSPAEGDWLYFVTVNLDTGEMAYATTFEEHQKNVQKFQAWIAAQPTTTG